VHPCHMVVLAGATVFGIANWSLLMLLVAVGTTELLMLGVVARLHAFRRYVDGRLDQIERLRAAEQRATLLSQMGDEHRRELIILEGVVDRIRDVSRVHGSAAQVAIEECLSLLSSFVRLAIMHCVSRHCVASVDRKGLDEESQALELACFSPVDRTRDLARRRLAIARKRIEQWERSREALEAIAHQLALIGDLIRLTYEQLTAPVDPTWATNEIECRVQVLDSHHETLAELQELFQVEEEPIEPQLLEMGRMVARV
jgi:hypothetical protein